MNDIRLQRMEVEGMVFQARIPLGEGPQPVFLLLHGWTGDENSMWVFAGRLPKEALLLAPRGLYESSFGGYGWYPQLRRDWPELSDFQPAIDQLLGALQPKYFPSADFASIRVVGFSQGAALAYSLALRRPEWIRSLAGLSGFVPTGVEDLANEKPLEGKQIFVSHGTKDQLVPVERARDGVRILQTAGGIVSYCEEEVGHKLSAACFRSMQIFFQHN